MKYAGKFPHVAIVHVPYLVAGGEERYVASLATSYESAGAKVSRWPGTDQGSSSDAFRALTSGSPSEWNRTFEEIKPDFLHLNNLHPVLGPAFLRWIKKKNIPSIATIHNHRFYCTNGLALYGTEICKACKGAGLPWRPLVFNCNENWAKSYYHGIGLAQIQRENLLSSLKALIAPSDYIASELLAVGISPHKVRTIPHPVDVKSGENEQAEGFDCIYAGRFSVEKGVRRLLALAGIRPENTFCFVGQGPLESEIRAAAAKNTNIKIIENPTRPALLATIRESRAACVPSVCEESFSLFGAESLLLGTQTIVAPNESLRWLTKLPFSAIMAKGQEASALVEALEIAWRAPSPTEETLRSMREQFSPLLHGQALLEIWR